jgi:trehalose 6-phosphate synthase/phosphatase
MSQVFIVSNRLPVSIQKRKGEFHLVPSSGGLATGLSSVLKNGIATWVGWPGLYLHSIENKDRVTGLLHEMRMHPIFLSTNAEKKFYAGFCNNTIWPLFHYYPKLAEIETETWEAYQKANRDFCNELLKLIKEDDTIWIHDYHLFLLPLLLREKLPRLNIGFYLHIPFPSYEIFRILPWRDEILKGVLGADLAGFQTFDDMRHFQSAVSRILGFSSNESTIQNQEKEVKVDIFPIGIDFEKFNNAGKTAPVKMLGSRLKNIFGAKKLILSVDRLDISKGIPEKLKAFETFLNHCPSYKAECNLILVVVPSRTQVEMYRELKTFIEQEVGRINGKFGRIDWTPVRYMYRSVTSDMLSALYKICDIAFITPLRDGMNLVAKEYVASKTDGKGVLILSEMAGASKELSEAVVVNPNDINKMAEAIKIALEMPEKEQIQRNRTMQALIKKNNIFKWARIFMAKLDEISDSRARNEINSLKEVFPLILKKYNSAGSRILFLDYDGTLVNFYGNPADARPDDNLLNILRDLAGDKKNTLVLISGRPHQILTEWFAGLDIDLVAEHGIWTCKHGEEWVENKNINPEWKPFFSGIFENYADRTPGAFVEEKDCSLVWHYRNSDPDFGPMRARELISNIEFLSKNKDLRILAGNKVVELMPASINKGITASRWLQEKDYGFIIAIGDDVTDEDLFALMPENAITIKVGSGSSKAIYRINSSKQVRDLLKNIFYNFE